MFIDCQTSGGSYHGYVAEMSATLTELIVICFFIIELVDDGATFHDDGNGAMSPITNPDAALPVIGAVSGL